MINIEYKDSFGEEEGIFIDNEFNKYAEKNGVRCDYKPFVYVAKEDDKVVGLITGHSYYKEVHIGDLIVLEEYRHKHIGKSLMEKVIEVHKDKGFEYVYVTTHEFQAPEFYKKCGFELDFKRESKLDPKLTKYFFVKYL